MSTIKQISNAETHRYNQAIEHFVPVYVLASSKHKEGWENSRHLCKQATSSRNGFAYLSRILPAPRMFRWAYLNKEKVFYCSYKMILNTTSKAGESSLISSGLNSNDWQKENLTLRTKFYTGKTILENLPGEINATIIK